jgi:serine/threonine protein kinase
MDHRPPRMTPSILQATTRAYLNSPADEPSGTVPPPSGRYELGGLIATGGLGEVYRAWDRQLQRKVALKRIVPSSPVKGEAYGRAITEATHLAALQHPNIVSVYDLGMDDRGPYVVMELIEGETLEAVANRAAFPLDDFSRLARESLDGIAAAHHIGLLHRDLKPSNLMLRWGRTSSFQVKLLDFGLAKISAKPELQTRLQDNSVFGSIHYMAPEQFEGKPFDQRTDLYALGCMFYYALTRQNPFQGDTVAAVMSAHLNHTFTSLELLRPDLAPELSAWVTKFFNFRPDHRHETAMAALLALDGIVAPTRDVVTSPSAAPIPALRMKVVLPSIGLGAALCAAWILLIQPMISGQVRDIEVPKITRPTAAPADNPEVAAILRPTRAANSAAELAALREKLGQVVHVEGAVTAMNEEPATDTRLLRLGTSNSGAGLVLAFPNASQSTEHSAEALGALVGKKISVEGTLSESDGALRLWVSSFKLVP